MYPRGDGNSIGFGAAGENIEWTNTPSVLYGTLLAQRQGHIHPGSHLSVVMIIEIVSSNNVIIIVIIF